MPEGLKRIFEPFMALSSGKRLLVVAVVAISIVAFGALITIANKTDYRPLFTNLTGEDAGEIIIKLKDAKTPYKITPDGTGVMVPSDRVHELRLALASEGLPQGGGVGFEIFDRKNFGMTEFVQKLNYQRALQGELARTIAQINGVEQARVHLAIPEKTLFKETEKPPTASIVLKLKGNRNLSDNEVQGIMHLVAASIEGMNSENVTVLDGKGKVLSKGGAVADATAKTSNAMQELQRNYESNLEARLQSLLDPIVGGGKSVARVAATFDFKRVERLEEKFDPESIAVRSEQRTESKSESGARDLALPGVQTNLERTDSANIGTSDMNSDSRNDETFNYEVSRSTARIIEPVGALSKVSVAILVDGKYDTPPVTKENKEPVAKYIPRSPEELRQIEELVKGAIGFNPERGDQLSIQNIPFQEPGEGSGVTVSAQWWTNPFFLTLAKNLVIALGFVALMMMVIRPMLNMLRTTRPPKLDILENIAPETQEKMSASERAQLAMHMAEQQDLIEKAKANPYQVAQILQNWIREES